MTIGNMQQSRQLRAGGGIMAVPRQKYGFGGIGKVFKKAFKGLKKVAKSPIGKAALIGGLGMIPFGASGATGWSRLGGMMKGMGGTPASGGGGLWNALKKNLWTDRTFGQKAWLGGGALATMLPFMTGGEEEEIIEAPWEETPSSIGNITSMLKSGDPSMHYKVPKAYAQKNWYTGANGGVVGLANGGGAGEEQMMQMLKAEYMKYRQNGGTMPFEQFAQLIMQKQQQQQQGQTQMAADGGRIGYNIGGPTGEEEIINEDTQEVVSNPDPMAELNMLTIEIFGKPYDQLNDREQDALQNFMSQNPEEEVIDQDETIVEDRVQAADGGMMDYMSSANPMAKSYIMEDEDVVNMYRPGGPRQMAQEGGIMDLGGMEKDYRQEGGFVPLGGQEKADDVPARLSKNEFVFTADAVRAAGGGDIDQGAEVMQNVMDNLESGGQISEESQGGNPAQEMFDTSQELESRIA